MHASNLHKRRGILFTMEYRQLGRSGLMVPELCFGCGTFGGKNEFFDAWGATEDIADYC